MIKKFEEFITEQDILNFIDIDIINESRKEAKRVAEIAKKQCKKWNKDVTDAMHEYTNAIMNKELMINDFRKYTDECNKKMRKFNSVSLGDDNKLLTFSFIIYLIANIKEKQTMLFKYGLDNIKQSIKLNKKFITDMSSYKGYVDDDVINNQIYSVLYKNQKSLEKYIKELVERTSENIENTCKSVNDQLDSIEEKSDIQPIVFGDAKIKNKERSRIAKEFITVYHSDIEYFVKEYKLIGIEYDKRIKLVDKQEIFNRFYKKIMKTIEEEYNK